MSGRGTYEELMPVAGLILLACAAESCSDAGLLEPVWSEEGVSSLQEECWQKGGDYHIEKIPLVRPAGVDILVVVDNSADMAAEQDMLRDAFPGLIKRLLDPPADPSTGRSTRPPVRDMHIGVVSTDMGAGGYPVQTCEKDPARGDDGVLRHRPHGEACESSYPAYLSYLDEGGAETALDGIEALVRDFGCIAAPGTDGCGFEQHLEAAYKALAVHARPGGPNDGFLRPDTILAVLFVTDEDDCSAADTSIFDVQSIPYSINLQCFYQAAKLHPVDRYAEAFEELRPDPGMLVLGFIAGVPPGEACEGRGDEIGGCLEVPAMQETVRSDGVLLEPACAYPPSCTPLDPPQPGDCVNEAFPARRLVRLAQRFGESAAVASACTDTFTPALAALAARIEQSLERPCRETKEELPAAGKEREGCRCFAACRLFERLSDDRPCPDGKPAFDRDGDTVPDLHHDEATGRLSTLCEIPQAGAKLEDCSAACGDPKAALAASPGRVGWWYDPTRDLDGDGTSDPAVFFEGIAPEAGSELFLECCTE